MALKYLIQEETNNFTIKLKSPIMPTRAATMFKPDQLTVSLFSPMSYKPSSKKSWVCRLMQQKASHLGRRVQVFTLPKSHLMPPSPINAIFPMVLPHHGPSIMPFEDINQTKL